MATTKIEWTNMSWNPCTGCTPIGIGCSRCYAERICYRFWKKWGREAPPNHFKVMLHPDRLDQPLGWKEPCMIFVPSMGDLFHEDVPDEFILKVFDVIASCQRHTFQVLTKRPERMCEFVKKYCVTTWGNAWLGVSVSTQKDADENIPWLLRTPAAIRFVSAEPLLEEIDFTHIHYDGTVLGYDCLSGKAHYIESGEPTFNRNHIDQLIVGGESGAGARPMHPAWARSARDQCLESDIPYFFKQWGAWYPVPDRAKLSLPTNSKRVREIGDGVVAIRVGKKKAGRILDGRTWDEMPRTRSEKFEAAMDRCEEQYGETFQRLADNDGEPVEPEESK